MKLSQFKFKLPEDKIALHPTKYRDESRLMVLHRNTAVSYTHLTLPTIA